MSLEIWTRKTQMEKQSWTLPRYICSSAPQMLFKYIFCSSVMCEELVQSPATRLLGRHVAKTFQRQSEGRVRHIVWIEIWVALLKLTTSKGYNLWHSWSQRYLRPLPQLFQGEHPAPCPIWEKTRLVLQRLWPNGPTPNLYSLKRRNN